LGAAAAAAVVSAGALAGRVAWVTGAGRGIGAATARRLAAAGARVALCARTAAEVEAVAADLSGGGGASGGASSAYAAACDVGREDEVAAFARAATKALGPIDVLVNNAGILLVQPLAETTADEWRAVLHVNLDGAFLCARAVLPEMVRRGHGRIINVSSISGTLGTPRLTAYCASKWGLLGLTKALAEEVRAAGVQVLAVAPGSVDTRMLREGRPDLTPVMSADDVARTIVWLAAEAPAAMTGACVEIFG
jgi:NAD(P)-dependent dehydrogenase (short-subunit alcohol dehydrogenase family)